MLAYSDKGDFTYVLTSKQLGSLYLFKFDKDGKDAGKQRVDPENSVPTLFINPFVHNPNKPEEIFMPIGNYIWRNSDLTGIALEGSDVKPSTNWTKMSDARTLGTISAVDCSVQPENILYFGNNLGGVFRVDDAHLDDNYTVTPLGELGGRGYISSISIDPNNANSVLVCLSNYNRKSIYYSSNGGENWRDVSGNLEENEDGTGSGPACHVVKIIRDKDNLPVYLVGTTVGLFSTTGLPGTATIWNKEAVDEIGNCSVRDIDYRASDGLLLIGTHGCGSFSTEISKVASIPELENEIVKLFPNPVSDQVTYELNDGVNLKEIVLWNIQGQRVHSWTNQAIAGTLDLQDFEPGIYFMDFVLDRKSTQSRLIIE